MDENAKLEKFHRSVLAEIEIKTTGIQNEAKKYEEVELKKNEALVLADSTLQVQLKSDEYKQARKREVAKKRLDAKRDLLQKRNELTATIFDNIKVKLSNFASSYAYEEYILSAIKSFSTQHNLADVNLFVRKQDMTFETKIKKAYGLACTVLQDDKIELGGFIARSELHHAYFDETLEEKLQEQKSYFIAHSDFKI